MFWATQSGVVRAALLDDGDLQFVCRSILLGIRRFRTITGCVIASFGVVVGMWLERFLIIVPSLGHKYLPYSWGTYSPQPGRDHHHGRDVRGDGAALHAVREVRPDHLDLGAEGGRAPAAGAASAGDGRASAGKSAPMKAVYALYPDGHSAQQAVNGLRAAGIADATSR